MGSGCGRIQNSSEMKANVQKDRASGQKDFAIMAGKPVGLVYAPARAQYSWD